MPTADMRWQQWYELPAAASEPHTCPLTMIDGTALNIPTGTYDIYLAAADPHHCIPLGGPCTSWDSSLQLYESYRIRLRLDDGTPSGTLSNYTQFTTDIKQDETLVAERVDSNVDINWPINGILIEHRGGGSIPIGGQVSSLFAACAAFECVGGDCLGTTGTGCPVGQEECSPGSGKCKPIGAQYECCAGGELKYCDVPNDGICVGSGTAAQCEKTDVDCPVNTNDCIDPSNPGDVYCIPNGSVCCGGVGLADRYCPNGYQCAPDGQCFNDLGGSQTSAETQELNSNEF